MVTILCIKPRSPFLRRQTDASITEIMTVASKVQDIRHEHLCDGLLVTDNILCRLSPVRVRAERILHFADHHRNTIDDEHQIQTLTAVFACTRVHPLVGHYAVVVIHVLLVKETDVDVLTVLAKRIRVLLKEHLAELVIVLHKMFLRNGNQQCPQFVNHLFGLLGCNLIKVNECFFQPRSDKHVVHLSINLICRQVTPSAFLRGSNQHLFKLRFL